MTSRVPMTALARLGEVSRAYEIAADEYRGVVVAAAEADAAHRKARGKAVLREKAQSPGMSHAEAVTRAEADDTIADLYLARVTTAAVAESHLEKLRQLKEQQANGRSAVATDRDVDRLHAQGLSGAA